MSDEPKATLNTDRELWRENADSFYSPSIHVTESGGVGINVGGHVFVMPLRAWHALALAHYGSPLHEKTAPHLRHAYQPHPQYPWFCDFCGYPEHEKLKHNGPTPAVAPKDNAYPENEISADYPKSEIGE